jgi:16S rRNA processing protein RimM
VSESDWVLVARLVRTQGRRGELLADLLTDFHERFAERKRLYLRKPGGEPGASSVRKVQLESHWLHKGRIVLKFAGIDSISDAELLRGLDVAIPAAERAPLDDGSVYISDLIGCHVIDIHSNQRDAGEVVNVDRDTTATPLLVVRAPGQKDEVLIPFAKAFLRKVDLDAKRIEMELPEGLLEVNSPLTPEELAAKASNAEELPDGDIASK